jgi:hypothetical protein
MKIVVFVQYKEEKNCPKVIKENCLNKIPHLRKVWNPIIENKDGPRIFL